MLTRPESAASCWTATVLTPACRFTVTDAVDQALLLGLHALDLSTDAAQFQFHCQDIRQFNGALAEQIGQALFGVARVCEPRVYVDVLRGDFFAALRFCFYAAESVDLRHGWRKLIGGNA